MQRCTESGYSKLMIHQDLENIKNMQLSTLSVAVLVVEQDKKQNIESEAFLISSEIVDGKNIVHLINLF